MKARILGVVWYRSPLITIDHDEPCPKHNALSRVLADWRAWRAEGSR